MSTDTGIKRKLCRELPREKGESFEVWHKELMDAAHGEGDEDASWAETYLGQDPRAGLTPAQTRRRAQRNRQAVSALLAVIPDTDFAACASLAYCTWYSIRFVVVCPVAVSHLRRLRSRVARWYRAQILEMWSTVHSGIPIFRSDNVTVTSRPHPPLWERDVPTTACTMVQ